MGVCWVSALTTVANIIANPSDTVTISDEAEALRLAIACSAQTHSAVAVNHVGFEKDVQLCESIAELDVVIGGHSHTNLDQGQYPHKVLRGDGSVCWVLTAYAFGRFVGFVDVSFDQGVAKLSTHAYIPLDIRVPLSQEVSVQLEVYTERLGESILQTVAVATDAIEMGNLLCDAMLAHAGPQQGAQVCIQNSGGMRASIDEDDITIEEILSVLPFGNVYAVLTVPGSAIVGALEYGFDAVVSGEIAGRFPQVGGMRVVVDYSKARSANELSRFTLVSSQSIWACSTCW
eukprot:TRINITY_DN917_c0_g1_i2.p1 TRINITY_DN917_c0_g1~~TRINITY_DN917_c0_g1_i2.p1  ORF type:complete len:289 (-),score=54.93 TRINITY_DN917_c0_g1_i2:471-1337(-)